MLREEFDDWAVLFDPDTGHGFGLNPTGVYLWKLLDGEHTLDVLLQEIRHSAEGVPDEARKHIGTFIDELIAEGLAGFDSTTFGLEFGLRNSADSGTPYPEKCSHPPLGAVSWVKGLTYEPPKLVDLRGGGCAARGDCVSGSQDSGSCSAGGGAGANCWTGSSPFYGCLNGPSAPGGRCCTGTSPAWASNCDLGNCPTRCPNCTTGGGMCQFGDGAGGNGICASGSGG
ncbi:MAG: SynChlorMet cassette protein ScmD [Syntrophorhabdales bacterium]